MNIYSIYRATNVVNGKIYIGYTCCIRSRIKSHKSKSRKGSNNAFHRALRKYGEEKFKWDVIYQSKDQSHTLNVMEPYFINEYMSFRDCGYNMTPGGEGNVGLAPWNKGLQNVYSSEVLAKMSNSAKLRKASVEEKAKRSELMTGDGHFNYGKFGAKNPSAKTCIVITPENRVILMTGINQFCKENSLSSGNASRCMDGELKHQKGYRFFRFEQSLYDTLLISVPPLKRNRSRLNQAGLTLEITNSISDSAVM